MGIVEEAKMIIEKTSNTYWARIYISGPIEEAKQIIRRECIQEGLCITIEPTLFIYTGGEENGYVIGLINYPRFPSDPVYIKTRAHDLCKKLMTETYQYSALIMTVDETIWITQREQT